MDGSIEQVIRARRYSVKVQKRNRQEQIRKRLFIALEYTIAVLAIMAALSKGMTASGGNSTSLPKDSVNVMSGTVVDAYNVLTEDGNMWSYDGLSSENIGQEVTVYLYTNGTTDVSDDEVLSVVK